MIETTPEGVAVSDQVRSPRLRTVTNADIEAFWAEVAEVGTPLFESIPDDNEQLWVTFLWRATEPVESVAVYGGGSGWSDNRMRRLADTDVWYLTQKARRGLRGTYRIAVNDPDDESESFAERSKRWIADPLNPTPFVLPADPEDPDDREYRMSVVELPGAPERLWTEPRDTPAGEITLHRRGSEILGDERRVWTYTPPGYSPDGEPCRLLVSFDGSISPTVLPVATILDNLHAAKQIPPTAALLVSHKDRDLELACHQPFVDFLADELLPWARDLIRISADPRDVIVAGQSLGGLAAAFAAMRRPDVFGNVLSQSGSFWWSPEDDDESEWLTREFAEAPAVPVRFSLEVGLLETDPINRVGPSMLTCNRHLRTVLCAKGYPDVHYREFNGGHDYVCWRESFGDGLIALSG